MTVITHRSPKPMPRSIAVVIPLATTDSATAARELAGRRRA